MPRACAPTSPSSLLQAGIDWWSRVALPGSHVAPRVDLPTTDLHSLRLPDLTGKTVLHVGAHDGYLCFAAERLGADRVVASDRFAWSRPGGKDRFEYAREALASNVEDVDIDISDITPEAIGEFDIVLFLDLFHRMRHPLSALERVARVTGERLIVETLTDLTFLRSPAAAFYPWNMLGDDTIRWGPNRAAIVGMLLSLGFDRAAAFPTRRFTRERLRSLPARLKTGIDVLAMTPVSARPRLRRDLVKNLTTQNRLVAHGWRASHQ
jgi:tRNA (mo5U34)-methyltransferase